MVKIDTITSNAELDALAFKTDARQGEVTLRAVYDFLGRFVAYPSEHAHVAHALWIVHAHLMDRWELTPRLAFLSAEPASGKTRALEITELLVPNPVLAVNMSPAYLFRKVGADDGVTILFDEIDTVFGPKAKENEEVRGLLNAGHGRDAVAGRCVVRGAEVHTEEIPAYAAVALAGLGWLPDTILSRSVVIRMRRRHAGEEVEPYRRRLHRPSGDAVKRGIEVWARSVPKDTTWPELPAEIIDRDADVWEPLVAVADLAGGEWPSRARTAAVALVAAGKEREPSLGLLLLAHLKLVFDDDNELSSKTILARLHALDEAPWCDLKGKPLDERGLAHRLRQYDVRSRTVRIGDATPKGYRREDLHDVWRRYLPSADRSATSATSATSLVDQHVSVADAVSAVPQQAQHVADVADGVADAATENISVINDVSAVAAVADLPGDRRGQSDDGIPAFSDRRPKIEILECRFCGGEAEIGNPVNEVSAGGRSWPLHRKCVNYAMSDTGAL